MVVSFSIDFPSNSKWDVPFHCIAYDYSCGYCDGLPNYLRAVSWEDIFKVGASGATSEFCEWIQVGIDVSIPHCKHWITPHSDPWLTAACAAAIVHRNFFFCFYEQNKSSKSKVKFK